VSDDRLPQLLKPVFRKAAGEPTAFGPTWDAAIARHRRARRSYGAVAVSLVAAAVVAVTFAPRPPAAGPTYIEMAELLGTTHWSAPSDVLLPRREFDIYREVPVLFEST